MEWPCRWAVGRIIRLYDATPFTDIPSEQTESLAVSMEESHDVSLNGLPTLLDSFLCTVSEIWNAEACSLTIYIVGIRFK